MEGVQKVDMKKQGGQKHYIHRREEVKWHGEREDMVGEVNLEGHFGE